MHNTSNQLSKHEEAFLTVRLSSCLSKVAYIVSHCQSNNNLDTRAQASLKWFILLHDEIQLVWLACFAAQQSVTTNIERKIKIVSLLLNRVACFMRRRRFV